MSGTATTSWVYSPEVSITYTTWNSADKDADIILSGGDLTTSVTGGGTGGIRSLIGKASGKWYWEYNLTTLDTKQVILGIANSTWGVANYILGVLLNMTDGEISFRVNNTDVGVAFTGISGTIYAALGNINANHIITANFGATAFVYSVPAGYNSGLYN